MKLPEPKASYTIANQRRYLESVLARDQFTEENKGKVSPLQSAVLKMVTVALQDGGGLVLDAGCGTAKTSHFLQSFEGRSKIRVIPVDLSAKVLSGAVKAYPEDGLTPVVGDVRSLPFITGRFQGVLVLQVLEFMPLAERLAFTTELARVTAEGGRLYLCCLQGRQQAEYEMDITMSGETGMLYEPVKQWQLYRDLQASGFELEKVQGLGVYNGNDFLIAIARRLNSEQFAVVRNAKQRQPAAESPRPADEKAARRAALWA